MNPFDRKVTPGFLLKYTLPCMIMMVFNSIYTMVDGGFVSNFVGTGALSAINIVYPLLNLVFAVGIMLATGGSAIVARQMGEGDKPKARQTFSLLVLFGTILGIFFLIIGFCFTEEIVLLLGANKAIYEYCLDYALYLCPFLPFAILQILFQFFFSTEGKPQWGLITTVIGGVLNILLDYLFIVPLGMGIKGAAIATGIGFTVPSLIGLFYFAGKKKRLLFFVKPALDFRSLLKACTNGSSEMVSNLSVAVTTFLFNIIMMELLGEDGVAAMTIVFYAQFLFTAVFLGYTSGVAPLISFHFGAKNSATLKSLVRLSLSFVGLCSILAFALSLFLAGTVVSFFAPPGSPVFQLASEGMGLFAVGFLFMGSNLFASGLFTALSNGKVSAILSFLRTFVFLLLTILLLPKVLGVNGIWLSIPIAELLALLVSIWYLARLRKVYQY